MERLISFVGLAAILGIAWLLSKDRRRIDWRLVAMGLGLQILLALIVLKTSPGRIFFDWMNEVFLALMDYSRAGASFVFGNLVVNNIPVGTPEAGNPEAAVLALKPELWAKPAAAFAFGVLPTVIFFSALMAVLYHLGVMNQIVYWMALLMKRSLRTSGAESLAAAANIFVGQTEAPLVIRPYLEAITRSEMLAIMVGGMANIAGGVLAAYVAMLSGRFPDIAGHLMAASIMSAPASLLLAKMLLPETERPVSSGELARDVERIDANVIDAATRGASEGLQLALNIAAMLIAFLALVALFNSLWGGIVTAFGTVLGLNLGSFDTIQEVLGYLLSPLAYLLGISWNDCFVAGQLLGEKTVLNEFVAYAHLGDYLNGLPLTSGGSVHELSERSKTILAYALCGFANIGSIGIQVGGISALVPSRRKDLARLGLYALIGGTLSTFMTATIAGILI